LGVSNSKSAGGTIPVFLRASATQKKYPEYREKIVARETPTRRSCRQYSRQLRRTSVRQTFCFLGVPCGVLGVAMAARVGEARNLCFRVTLPEDAGEEYPLLDPSQWPDCTYCVYQLEIGDETSRLHFQGYVEFTGKKRYNWVQNNCEGMEGAHLEVRRGTMEEARNYAMKHETRLDGPWEWGAPKPGQGSRSDLRAVKRALDEGRKMSYIADNFFGTFLRYNRGIREYKRIRAIQRNWAMELVFIIGPSGTGKSRHARDISGDDVYFMMPGKWWEDYEGQHTVVWDEFYGHSCPFSLLLRILDRYPLKLECKGGAVEFNSRRIIFTSNQEPRDWYNAERTHQMDWNTNPLNRRIQEFGRVLYTGQVHVVNPVPVNWNGVEYVNLMPPPMMPRQDLDNPNEFFVE